MVGGGMMLPPLPVLCCCCEPPPLLLPLLLKYCSWKRSSMRSGVGPLQCACVVDDDGRDEDGGELDLLFEDEAQHSPRLEWSAMRPRGDAEPSSGEA